MQEMSCVYACVVCVGVHFCSFTSTVSIAIEKALDAQPQCVSIFLLNVFLKDLLRWFQKAPKHFNCVICMCCYICIDTTASSKVSHRWKILQLINKKRGKCCTLSVVFNSRKPRLLQLNKCTVRYVETQAEEVSPEMAFWFGFFANNQSSARRPRFSLPLTKSQAQLCEQRLWCK